MTSGRGVSRSWAVVPIAAALLLAAATAASAADSQPKNFFLQPTVNFDASVNTGALFTSCSMPPQQQQLPTDGKAAKEMLKDMALGRMGIVPTLDIDKKCPDSELPEDAPACTDYTSNGAFDEKGFKKEMDRLAGKKAGIDCEHRKLDAIDAELKCVSGAANSISNQISAQQQAFIAELSRLQGEVQTANTMISDRDSQIENINILLDGPSGLRKAQAELQPVLAQMPSEISRINEAYVASFNSRKMLEEYVQSRQMALANECFNTRTDKSYKCDPNGPPVSAREYVICRYYQNSFINDRGQIVRNANFTAAAEANKRDITQLLDQILKESPTDATPIPVNDKGEMTPSNGSRRVLSPDDVNAVFGTKLSSFNSKGLNIKDFVLKTYRSCFTRSVGQVANERKQKGSTFGRTETQMQAQERDVSRAVKELLVKYRDVYVRSKESLSLAGANADVSLCNDAAPNVQIGCLKDFQKKMTGLLDGNTTEGLPPIVVKGSTMASTAIPPRNCKGLNACIRELTTLSTDLQNKRKNLVTQKKNYIAGVNRQIEMKIQQMADAMSPASQYLTDRMKAINSALRSVGVSQGIRIERLRGEQLRKGRDQDGEGIYENPENLLNLIGGKTKPPLMDMQADDFSDSTAAVADAVREVKRKEERYDSLKRRMDSRLAECRKQADEDVMSKVANDLGSLNLDQCLAVERYCGDKDKAAGLIESMNQVKEAFNKPGTQRLPSLSNIQGYLDGGIAACEDLGKKKDELQRIRDDCNDAMDAEADSKADDDFRSRCDKLDETFEKRTREKGEADRQRSLAQTQLTALVSQRNAAQANLVKLADLSQDSPEVTQAKAQDEELRAAIEAKTQELRQAESSLRTARDFLSRADQDRAKCAPGNLEAIKEDQKKERTALNRPKAGSNCPAKELRTQTIYDLQKQISETPRGCRGISAKTFDKFKNEANRIGGSGTSGSSDIESGRKKK